MRNYLNPRNPQHNKSAEKSLDAKTAGKTQKFRAFTKKERDILEASFQAEPFPKKSEKQRLARLFSSDTFKRSEKSIATWFENHRRKWKLEMGTSGQNEQLVSANDLLLLENKSAEKRLAEKMALKSRSYHSFTKEETNMLKAFFLENPFPSKAEIEVLASQCSFDTFKRTPQSVTSWFHNHRRLYKKEMGINVQGEESVNPNTPLPSAQQVSHSIPAPSTHAAASGSSALLSLFPSDSMFHTRRLPPLQPFSLASAPTASISPTLQSLFSRDSMFCTPYLPPLQPSSGIKGPNEGNDRLEVRRRAI